MPFKKTLILVLMLLAPILSFAFDENSLKENIYTLSEKTYDPLLPKDTYILTLYGVENDNKACNNLLLATGFGFNHDVLATVEIMGPYIADEKVYEKRAEIIARRLGANLIIVASTLVNENTDEIYKMTVKLYRYEYNGFPLFYSTINKALSSRKDLLSSVFSDGRIYYSYKQEETEFYKLFKEKGEETYALFCDEFKCRFDDGEWVKTDGSLLSKKDSKKIASLWDEKLKKLKLQIAEQYPGEYKEYKNYEEKSDEYLKKEENLRNKAKKKK
jgi:hypothetical protein